MMYDLSRFTREEIDHCGEVLRSLGSGASSMEEAANRIVRHLFDTMEDSQNRTRACALVRFYKTHSYEDLNGELRGFAQGILGHAPESHDMK